MNLTDELMTYRDSDIYPMHMPGHKRNKAFLNMPDPYGLDITEIDGFDNLHDAKGILYNGMKKASKLYNSDQTFYLINGSTCGILAGITACTRKGDRILVSRNCHKSVFNAISLNELNVVYLYYQIDTSFGIQSSITPKSVADALEQYNDIRLIVITSPTYDGVISDIAQIAKLAHEHGIPLLVDEAHGAHLGFSDKFHVNSIQAGADVVIHSLHKTLPAFTQSALLHIKGNLVNAEDVRRQLAVFETSSPSYILMAGIDSCIDLLMERKEELFNNYSVLLGKFSKEMCELKNIKVFSMGKDSMELHPSVFNFDRGKIVISTADTNLTGMLLSDILLRKYRIQLEMASGDYALALTSICDTAEGFDRLSNALKEIDASLSYNEKQTSYSIIKTEAVLPIHTAEKSTGLFVPLDSSIGLFCREYVYAYPPGIPLIVPGEKITKEIIDNMNNLSRKGVELKSTFSRIDSQINVIK